MKQKPTLKRATSCQTLSAVTAALAAAGLVHSTYAQVQSAGDLFVNINATSLAEGPLASIPNTGTLAGFFAAVGGAGTIPTIATEGGTKGIRFGGTDFLQHVDAVGGTLVSAPGGLVGPNPTRSIEAWVLNPAVAGEETIVSWGRRGGGPDGSNIAFNFGSDARWGALGQWGSPDLGWDNNGGSPAPNQWHHLAYTFDGSISRVYSDGVLANFEILAADTIDTHPDTPISIATQMELNAAGDLVPTGGLRGSLTIARLRVHNDVLSPTQIANNFTFEKPDFVDPEPIPPTPPVSAERLSVRPLHGYSFSEPAAADAADKQFADYIGTAHGTVKGEGTQFTGSRLTLAGGPSSDAGYGDLPNGLLSSNSANNGGTGEFSIETWLKVTGAHTWSRVFDIGSSVTDDETGEVTGPGGGGTGLDYLEYSAQIGDNTSSRRLEVRNEDPAGGGVVTSDLPTSQFNTDGHVVVTWQESSGRVTVYENGAETGFLITNDPMSDIKDVNVWLGRSNWTADQNTQGEYDEVRIYNHVLTPGETLGNFLAGPDLYNDHDFAVTILAQPESRDVPETSPATFRVTARGSSPVSFQWLRNGTAIPGATSSSYTLAAASPADSGAVFSVEVSNTVGGAPVKVVSNPATLSVFAPSLTLKHRYSFNEPSGSAVTDSVSGANGTVIDGGTFGSGRLSLNGVNGYVDLPNGLITALGNDATIEMWITYKGVDSGPWARVFDFGSSDAGEGEAGNGVDYLFYTSRIGDGWPRFEVNSPASGVTTVLNHPGSSLLGEQEHIAITYSSAGNIARLFSNGAPIGTGPAPTPLSAFNNTDVNNWLGRSQFVADAFWEGDYNELRIYQGAMAVSQVAASFAAGPDALPVAAPTLTILRSGNSVIASWPAAATGFTLEQTAALGSPTVWTSLGDGTPVVDGKFQVTVPITAESSLLRLRR